MIDRRPAIIARCAGPADVITCIRFAREHDIVVAVRGGGHSVAGKSVCDGGLMIDLSAMKGIRVDPARRTVPDLGLSGSLRLGIQRQMASRFLGLRPIRGRVLLAAVALNSAGVLAALAGGMVAAVFLLLAGISWHGALPQARERLASSSTQQGLA
jgi:hypothetical protein